MCVRVKANGGVFAEIRDRLVAPVGRPVFGFDDFQRCFSPPYGKVDHYLRNLVDLGPQFAGVGLFFDKPVSDRIQVIEARAGAHIEADQLFFASPKILHAGKAFKNKAYRPVQRTVVFVKGRCDVFHAIRPFDRQQGAGPGSRYLLLVVDEDIGPVAFAVGKTIDDRQ